MSLGRFSTNHLFSYMQSFCDRKETERFIKKQTESYYQFSLPISRDPSDSLRLSFSASSPDSSSVSYLTFEIFLSDDKETILHISVNFRGCNLLISRTHRIHFIAVRFNITKLLFNDIAPGIAVFHTAPDNILIPTLYPLPEDLLRRLRSDLRPESYLFPYSS